MRQSRDLYLVVLLFLALVGITAFAAARQAQADEEDQVRTPFSSHSVQPRGTRALQLWLESMGYSTQRVEGSSFKLDPAARVLFVLSPIEQLTGEETRSLREWTERGNTLVLCDTSASGTSPASEFQALIEHTSRIDRRLTLEQPILGEPEPTVMVQTDSALKLSRSDFVTYLSDSAKPLLVTFKQGQGIVWLCSTPSIVTNGALQDNGNGALVGAILSKTPRGSLVAFDEYHLGFVGDKPTLQSLLFSTPWGWAILYALVVAIAYLAINGQHFGRIQSPPPAQSWRAAAEYVTSMAQLFRRGGKRSSALHHYRMQLKRSLGRPYRLSPDMSDEEFVSKLAQYRDDIAPESLIELLRSLEKRSVDERTLIKLAQQAVSTASHPPTVSQNLSSRLPGRY